MDCHQVIELENEVAVELCRVCGDVSSGGHNRTVFSCETCKAFFKRTMMDNLEYTCKFNKECTINKETRDDCQFCRLKKCFSSGMLMDYLQSTSIIKRKRYNEEEGGFPCDKCDGVFNTRGKLSQHNSFHHKPKRFVCNVCPKAFHSNRDLQLHLHVHTGKKPFKCNVCGAMLSKSYSYIHMRIHTGVKPYKCEICQKFFRTTQALKLHTKTHFQTPTELKVACFICDSKFTTEAHLSTHMVMHTKDQQFPCSICDKTFLRAGNLKQHMASHCYERNHVCKICKKSFKLPSHLNTHMKTHGCDNEDEFEPEQPSYSFECDICGKKYKTEFHFKSHKLEQHYKDVADEKDATKYSYYCEICEKQFKTKIGYNKHIATLHKKDGKK